MDGAWIGQVGKWRRGRRGFGRRVGRLAWTGGLAGLLLVLALGLLGRVGPVQAHPAAGPAAAGLITLTTTAVGDPLPGIQCLDDYKASVYAEGLSGPDGLAFGPDGTLYVVEESAGRVSRVGPSGLVTPVLTGLDNPEGIAFDGDGVLYVVEDIFQGRVVSTNFSGPSQTVASGLWSPEGIVWVDDGSADGVLYVTEQTIEYGLSVRAIISTSYETYVTAVPLPAGPASRILTRTAVITPNDPLVPDHIDALFWSFSGIMPGPDGHLYVANELSGRSMTGTFENVYFIPPYHVSYSAASNGAVYTATAASGSPADSGTLGDGLVTPEGLRFSAGGGFPLYVAEEDVDGSGAGRLSRVDAAGNATTFCAGFGALEDVIVDQAGRLYVTEDGAGRIILLQRLSNAAWLPLLIKD